MDKILKEKIIETTFEGLNKIIEKEYEHHPNEKPYSNSRVQEGYNDYLRISFKNGEINYFRHNFNLISRSDLKIICEDLKKVKKDDFEKESGKSQDATSGHGIRCSVKEADKIKGTNITASFATLPSSLFALVTGHTYNEKTGELYIDNAGNPPLIAMRYFVEQYEEGNNTKSSFTRVKAITFPSCQIAPQGSEASEDAFGAAELQGSGGDNKRSDLPLKFIKEISSADYTAYVGM